MTNIDTLRNIAGANWTNQYIDRDLNLQGRCALGRAIQLLVKYSGCDFLRSSLNSLCSVDLATTADKLTKVMQNALSDADATSLDETKAVITSAADKFNLIAIKSKLAEIDVTAIFNNKSAPDQSVPDQPVPDESASVDSDTSLAQPVLDVENHVDEQVEVAADPVVEPVVDQVVDPVADQAAESIAEPVADAADVTVSNPAHQYVAHAEDAISDSTNNSGTDSDAKPIRRKKRLGTSVRTTNTSRAETSARSKSVRVSHKYD